MSKVVKTVKKAFKKIRENKILKTIVIAAAIYYTASLAAEAFAAPTPGLSMELGSTGFTGATEALGGDIAVSGVGDTLAADVAGTIGAPVSEVAGATGLEAGGGAIDLSLAGGGGAALPPPPGSGIVSGAMDWMKANPMATMLLGQGVSGAAQAKSEEEAAAKVAAERRERGLFGVDYGGEYQGGAPRPGIVSSQVDATKASAVAGQDVGEQAVRPIQKKNYPQLAKQGLIAKKPGV